MAYVKQNFTDGTTLTAEHLNHIENGIADLASSSNTVISSSNYGNFFHVSFDDVTICLSNLTNNTYTSLFDEPFFGWMKNLHEQYGAVFSLYVYLSSIKSVPDTYKQEFMDASSWLKIGLHSTNASATYNSASASTGKTDWDSLVSNVVRITGTINSVDRCPRLHTFGGSSDAIRAMRDCDCGAVGFLAADDSRTSYNFTTTQKNYLYNHDILISQEDGLVFFRTDMRGDWFLSSFSSSNTYVKPTKTNVYDELVYRYSLPSEADSFRSYIYFAHEWQFYSGTTLNTNKTWTEDACKFAYDYNIAFDFPQNRLNPSLNSLYLEWDKLENLISSSSSGSDSSNGSDNSSSENISTTTFGSDTISIVNDISDMEYKNGYSIGGGLQSYATATGRAASSTCLAVNGGETISLTQNIDGITVNYAMQEYTGAPLSSSTLTSSGQTFNAWLSTATTLQSDTKYIMIGFKQMSNVNFTDEQVALLNDCLTIS